MVKIIILEEIRREREGRREGRRERETEERALLQNLQKGFAPVRLEVANVCSSLEVFTRTAGK